METKHCPATERAWQARIEPLDRHCACEPRATGTRQVAFAQQQLRFA